MLNKFKKFSNGVKTSESPVYILGIETSCDETAVSVVEARDSSIRVLSSIVSSQATLHAKWGGVVPNLAAREHLKNIVPVLKLGLKEARLTFDKIGLIATTQGPGLIPALLIGTNFSKTLSYVWQKPLLGIHHIEGHIYANFIDSTLDPRNLTLEKKNRDSRELRATSYESRKNFPILCLVVSGGHTQLILMKKHLDYKIIGETLDDAVGEAFDKVARILGLGYPGGPIISQLATRNSKHNGGENSYALRTTRVKIKLPRPMINKNNLNFSFSGLKTAVLYETKKSPRLLKNKKYISSLCNEFQQAVIDVLVSKTLKAAKIHKPKTIMLAGGVSANQELRKQLGSVIKKELPFTDYRLPITNYSIDNAAMIAAAGYYRWKNMTSTQKNKALNNWKILQPDANLKLK